MKKWFIVGVVMVLVLVLALLLGGTRCVKQVDNQLIKEGSTYIKISGILFSVDYKVFVLDSGGKHYEVYLKNTPFRISICDNNDNGKIDVYTIKTDKETTTYFIDSMHIEDEKLYTIIEVHAGMDPPGQVLILDGRGRNIFGFYFTNAGDQLLEEAESIIRQLKY